MVSMALHIPVLLLVLQHTLASNIQEITFETYLARFNKVYENVEEYNMRKVLFEQRKALLTAVGSSRTWTAGINHLTDATTSELQSSRGYRKELRGAKEGQSARASKSGKTRRMKLPESVDWRQRSPAVCSPVKSQGGCGSCWAFAASTVIESHVAINTGVLLSLSPQEMTSCSPNPDGCGGDGGCSGATAQLAFAYAVEAGGVPDIWHDPYLSGMEFRSRRCENNTKFWLPRTASITGFVTLDQNDPKALMEAVAKIGPIAVSVDATDWWMYGGGIYDGCNKTAPNINHAVVLDGYGIENGTKYWLVRNSWGENFGENGYIRLRRYDDEPCGEDPDPLEGVGCKVGGPQKIWACGECGVLSDSSYPLGAGLGPKKLSESGDTGHGDSRRLRSRDDPAALAGVYV